MDKLKILIVDDDKNICVFMKAKLAKAAPHFSIKALHSGKDCISYLQKNTADCVLSDFYMPGMNGLELLKTMRQTGIDVPVIFVTAQGSEEVAREAFKGGAYDYFTKEAGFAHFARLVNSIERAVRHHESETAMAEAEQALKVRVRQQAAVADLGQSALEGAGLQKLMGQAVNSVAKNLDVSLSKILELRPDGKHFLMRAGAGWSRGLVGRELVKAGKSTQASQTILSRKPVIVEDYPTEKRFTMHRMLRDHGVLSGMSVIIPGKERAYGILCAMSTRRRTFTSDDISFLQSVANVLASATERRRDEEAVAASEEKYRSLIENANDAIFMAYADTGEIIGANRKAGELIGIPPEKIIGMHQTDLHPKGKAKTYAKLFRESAGKKGYIFHHDVLVQHKDGHAIPVQISSNVLVIGGRKVVQGIFRDITERTEAEESLRRQRDFSNTILETAPSLVCVMDTDARIVTFNKECERLTGYTSRDVLGRTPFDFLIPGEVRLDVKKVVAHLASGKSPNTFENEWITRSGKRRLISWSNSFLKGPDGKVQYIIATGVDVTEKRAASQAIVENNERLAILNRIDRAMLSALDFDSIIKTLLEDLAGALKMESGCFFSYDNHSRCLTATRSFNFPVDGSTCFSLKDFPQMKKAVKEKKPVLVSRAKKNSAICSTFGFVSVMLLPLVCRGSVEGLISICNKETVHEFTDDDKAFAQQVADQALIAIENSRMVRRLKENDEALRRQNKELAALNAVTRITESKLGIGRKIQLVLDKTLSLPFLSLEKKGIVFLVDGDDPSKLNMTAYTGINQVLVKTEKQIDMGHCLCGMAAQKGEVVTSEDCATDPHHTTRYKGMVSHGHVIVPIKHKKKLLGVMSYYTKIGVSASRSDVTFLESIASHLGMAIENATLFDHVATGKREWEDTFDAMQDLVTIHGPDYTILRANKAAGKALGLSMRDIIGKKCHELFHDESRPPKYCPAKKIHSGKDSPQMHEVAISGKNYEITTYPIIEKSRVTAFVHDARDVTDRKKAEEKLIQLNRLYSVLSEVNETLVRATDKDRLLKDVCRIAVERGRFAMAWVGMVDEAKKIVRPVAQSGDDDGYIRLLRLSVSDAPEGRGPTGSTIRTGRHHISNDIARDKRMKPWRKEALKRGYRSSAAFPIRVGKKIAGTFNVYAGITGFFTSEEIRLLDEMAADISYALTSIEKEARRKAAEQAVKDSENKYRQLIESANDAIFIVSASTGIVLDANKKAAELLGIPEKSIVGMSQADIHPPGMREQFHRYYKETIKAGQNINKDLYVLHKDGSEIPVEISASVVETAGGKVVQGIYRDITMRKLSEESLKEQVSHAALAAGIGDALTKEVDLGSMLRACTDSMVKNLDAAFARIWTYDENDNTLKLQASSGLYTHIDGGHRLIPVDRSTKIGYIASTRKHHLTNKVIGDPQVKDQKWAKREKMKAFAGHPLIVNDKLVGVMALFARKPLTQAALGALSSVSLSLALGIERRRTEEALHVEASVTSALLDTSTVMAEYMNWDDVVEKILKLLHKTVSSKDAALFMLNDDGSLLPQREVGIDSDERSSLFYTARLAIEEVEPMRMAAEAGRSVSLDAADVAEQIPEFLVKSMGLVEVIITPIVSRDKAEGFLVTNFERLPSDPRVLEILGGISRQLGTTYENTRLYEETQNKRLELVRKVETLKVLYEIDRMILSTLKRDEMLTRALMQTKRLISSDTGGIALVEPDGESYRFSYGWGLTMTKDEVVPAAEFPGSRALGTGKSIVRMNLEEERTKAEIDTLNYAAGVRSDMYVPIISKGIGVGIMYLGSSRVASFSMDDVDTAGKLANQIGIALENTRLVSDLEDMLVSVVKALASAIDAKSPWTKGHSERVTDYAVSIARKMALPESDIEKLRLAGLLHDVGKIGTYDTILDKPGKLTDEEFSLIRQHPDKGREILGPIKQLEDIIPAIRHHHERWDGRGYPAGLKGQSIPFMARILCVADSFDSMTADRPYRPSPGIEYAITEFERCAGTQFDPDVVKVFLDIIRKQVAL